MESEGSVPDAHEVAAALRVAIGMLYRRLKQTSPDDELTLAESSTLSRLERGGPCDQFLRRQIRLRNGHDRQRSSPLC